jgi:hypothetical protein
MATFPQFVAPGQCPITGSWTTLRALPFSGPPSFRTKPTIKLVALTGTTMSVGVDVFKFRKFADGEADNLHPAQPELLLQLLQIIQVAFPKTHRGGLNAGLNFVGHQTVSPIIRCSGNANGLPNDNQSMSFVETFGNSRYINELSSYDSRTLLLQLLFVLVAADRQTFSILDYLASAEAREEDVWLRDDVRIAWITVLNASQGSPIPQIEASYAVLGLHPDKVYPAIVARRAALLGPSKKPVTKSVNDTKEKAYAAKA